MIFNVKLDQYGISRPEKVQWIFPQTNLTFADHIRSKSLRKFVLQSDELLTHEGINTVYTVVDNDFYQKWYEFYLQCMDAHDYNVIAPRELIAMKAAEGKTVEGVFLYKQNTLLGGGIIIRKDDWSSLAYKASLRIAVGNKSNSSVGGIIDFLYLRNMTEKGIKTITGGRSRNAFGTYNSFGHLEYKLKFGYDMQPDMQGPILNEVPMSEKSAVAFLGWREEGKPLFCCLKKVGTLLSEEYKHYLPDGLQSLVIEI